MCFLAIIFYFYEYFLRVMPSAMHSELMQAFDINDTDLGSLVGYYYFAYMLLQIPAGLAVDLWGPRKTLSFACVTCSFGAVLFSKFDFINIARIGRFLIGFGSAFAFIGVLKLSNIWLPKKYFSFIAGLCSTFGMFGAINGELFITELLEIMSWNNCIKLSAIVGLIFTVILWLFIKETHVKVNYFHINFNKIWQNLLKIINIRQFWLAGIIGCFFFMTLSIFAEIWAIPYLEEMGFDKHDAAWGSALIFFGFGVGAPVWGVLSDFIGSRKIPIIMGAFTSLFLSFYIIYYNNPSVFTLYVSLFCYGLFTSVEILIFAIGNDISSSGMSALSTAFINTLVMLGGVVLQPLIGFILDLAISIDATDNFRIALSMLPVSLLIAGILSLMLAESYIKKK